MLVFFIFNLVNIIVLTYAIEKLQCEPLLINFIIFDTLLSIFSSLNLILEEMYAKTSDGLIAFMILNRFQTEVYESLFKAKQKIFE